MIDNESMNKPNYAKTRTPYALGYAAGLRGFKYTQEELYDEQYRMGYNQAIADTERRQKRSQKLS